MSEEIKPLKLKLANGCRCFCCLEFEDEKLNKREPISSRAKTRKSKRRKH